MSGFGGTVKLTGESEYQKALNSITSNLKVLSSEMKVVTTQFDRNDKSTENLAQQNDVLQKKIVEQKKAVELLKDAVSKSAKETGEHSEATNKWQTKLNNAQADLNKMERNVKNNEKAMHESSDATDKNSKSLKNFGEESEKAGKSSVKFGDLLKANVLSSAITSGFGLLVDGIKEVGSAFKDMIADGTAYADDILTLSAQTSLSTDTLQKYSAVAELTDVSMDTLTKTMSRNIKSMSQGSDAYDKLGVKVRDANGNLRDGETVYWETVDALKGIENETERDAISMQIFGKSARDLNTVIELGSDGVKEYTDKAVQMGSVLSEDGLKALGRLDDEFQIFKSTTKATGNILSGAFAPSLAETMGAVNDLGGSLNYLINATLSGDSQQVEVATAQVTESMTALITNLSENLPQMFEMFGSIVQVFIDVLNQSMPFLIEQGGQLLSSLIQGIFENMDNVVSTVFQIITTLINTIIANLPLIVQGGIDLLLSLLSGITQMIPTLIPAMVEAVTTIVTTLIDNIDLIIDAGLELIIALADGLLDAMPELVDKAPEIIIGLIDAFAENFPKVLEVGVDLIGEIVSGLIDSIPDLVDAIPDVIVALVDGFADMASDVLDIGTNIVEGIWDGITNKSNWLAEKVRTFATTMVDSIKNALGIHSPSRVMADQIGKNMALGVGVGFDDNMPSVTDSIKNAIPTLDMSANISGANSNISNAGYVADMIKVIVEALRDVKIEMNDREMGRFVEKTVEKVVIAQ